MSDINKGLVSVIVPVYNQEPYLKQCLDSIINQDYNNLQIIIIDDGSTDASSKICDEYASNDNRIEVIHKPNGGLSSARNAGLEHVKGDYVSFVDSDDWIDRDMISYLVSGIENYGCDISICNFVKESGNVTRRINPCVNKILSRDEGIKLLVPDKIIQNYVWNKLFKRNIVEGIKFPVNMIIEDMGTTYKYFIRADRIYLMSDEKYHYRHNSKSITNSPISYIDLHGLVQIIDRYRELKYYGNYKSHYKMMNKFLYNYLINYSITEDEELMVKKVVKFISEEYDELIKPYCSPLERKIYQRISKEGKLSKMNSLDYFIHDIKVNIDYYWNRYKSLITH